MSNIIVGDFIGQTLRVVEMPDRQGSPDGDGNPTIIKGNAYPALWIEDAYSAQAFMDDAAAETAILADKDSLWKLHGLYRARVQRFIPTISAEDLSSLTIRQLGRLHKELMAFEAANKEGGDASPLAPAEIPPTSTREPSSLM